VTIAVVTGASGFVGSHLVDALLDRGDGVVALDLQEGRNLAEASGRPGYRFVPADVRDASALVSVIDGSIDVIFHLAAIVGVRNYMNDPLAVLDVNVIGTRNVLALAERFDTRVVVTSTSEVFGRNPKVPWDEDDDRVLGSTRVDRWSYSTSKAMCEHLAFAMHRHRGLPVTVVRYFNAYGPRQAPIYVVSQTVQRVLRGEAPIMYDDGRQTRCFTYVRDAVEGTILAADEPAAIGEAFNLGASTESTVSELIEAVQAAAGTRLQPERLDTREHYGAVYEDIGRRVPATDKARRILRWSATTDVATGIADTIAWARANPWWLES
jgi:nucleoside-diphosphate-sugar epimerase